MKIDLGLTEKRPTDPCCVSDSSAKEKCEEKTFYPTLYAKTKEKVVFPDGRFIAVIEGRVIEKRERMEKEGDDHFCGDDSKCSYDIEVYSIEPKGDAKEADVGASLRKGAQKMMEKKKDEKEY